MINNNSVDMLVEAYTRTADRPLEVWEKEQEIVERKVGEQQTLNGRSRYSFLQNEFNQTRTEENTPQSKLDKIIKELMLVQELTEYQNNPELKEKHLKILDRQIEILGMQADPYKENITQGIKEYKSIREEKQHLIGNAELKYV